MKPVLLAISLLLSFTAFAEQKHVSFAYYGEREVYDCQFTGEQTQKALRVLGASDIRLNCRSNGRAVEIDVIFNMPGVTGHESKEITFKSDRFITACYFNTQMMRAVLRALPEVEVLDKDDYCVDANTRFWYHLSLSL